MKISLFRHMQQQFIAIKNRAIKGIASAAMLSALIGCSALSQGQPPPAPTVQTAQNLEQRAAQAYARGDAPAALADYQTAAQLYASLALGEPQARAQLSLARVQAELGQTDAARQSTAGVLGQTGLPVGLQVLAHGRMAALQLGVDQTSAQRHLDAAQALCTAACEQASALQALRTRLALAERQFGVAQAVAQAAYQLALTPSDRANALRLRAQAALGLPQGAASAAQDAALALSLDQSLGATARVLGDLRLLEQAHTALGSPDQARHYARLAQQAQDAVRALQTAAP